MTAAPDPSSLAPLRAKLREIKEEAELIAASLNAIRAGREPPIVASVQTLESRAEVLMREQVRLVLEIQSIERATSEPPPSVPLPAASRPVGDSAPKKAKVVQSTLVGYVLLHRKDDPHSPRAPPRTESYLRQRRRRAADAANRSSRSRVQMNTCAITRWL